MYLIFYELASVFNDFVFNPKSNDHCRFRKLTINRKTIRVFAKNKFKMFL